MIFDKLDPAIQLALWKMSNKSELAAIMKASTFVYGTAGSKIMTKVYGRLIDHIKTATLARTTTLRNIYDPGPRAKAFVHGKGVWERHEQPTTTLPPPLTQMMDLYYGQYGNSSFVDRSPIIGKYVHLAMGFTGDYDHSKPGYEAYWDTFGRVNHPAFGQWHDSPFYEGWEKPPENAERAIYDGFFYPDLDSPKRSAGMTATKYMSRAIRSAIMKLGGTLIFDGAEVYYEAVFSKRNVRDSDTATEARALFPYLAQFPRHTSAPFGEGTIKFQWFGQNAVPTKKLFSENWIWTGHGTHREGNSLSDFEKNQKETFTELWNKFPQDYPNNPSTPERVKLVNERLAQALDKIRTARNPLSEDDTIRRIQIAFRNRKR